MKQWPRTFPAQVPTTVQLPTFHYFTSTGTVVVPDGGEAFLGGIGSAAAGRTEQGILGLPSRPFTNSSIGSSTGAGNVSVSAQIHDFEAMDRAVLGETADGSEVRPSLAGSRLLAATKLGPEPIMSVAAIRAQMAAADAAGDKLAAAAMASGREMLAAGKVGVARIYFESAVKQASPSGRGASASGGGDGGTGVGKSAGEDCGAMKAPALAMRLASL